MTCPDGNKLPIAASKDAIPNGTVKGDADGKPGLTGEDAEDDTRWEQVRSRNRTVFNSTVKPVIRFVIGEADWWFNSQCNFCSRTIRWHGDNLLKSFK